MRDFLITLKIIKVKPLRILRGIETLFNVVSMYLL
jgi:hypothetical protein